MHCESPEQLRSRKDDETSCGKTESARERPLRKVQTFNRAAHNFAEPLDLAFSLKIDYDPGVARAPFFQSLDKLGAFCLGEHEIARAKLSNLAILKSAAEIFRSSFNPSFADLNVWRGELLRARRRRSSALHFGFDIDDQITIANVIANETALVRRSLIQQDVDRPQIAHG